MADFKEFWDRNIKLAPFEWWIGEWVDWSSLMTSVHTDLKLAEENLRLIHMDKKYLDVARLALLKAQEDLTELIKWTEHD